MKNSPWIPILVGVLLVSSALSVVFAVGWAFAARDLRRSQWQIGMVNNNQALVNSLGVDLVGYSQKDPGIDPLLEMAGFKEAKSGAAKPAGK